LEQTLEASERWQPTKAQWSVRCWCCWLEGDRHWLEQPHPQTLALGSSQALVARQCAQVLEPQAQQPSLALEALATHQQASLALAQQVEQVLAPLEQEPLAWQALATPPPAWRVQQA
jgi:hypothetical protein